jgi:hypothetical protein
MGFEIKVVVPVPTMTLGQYVTNTVYVQKVVEA